MTVMDTDHQQIDIGNRFTELLPQAVKILIETGHASISMLQRRLHIGYARAARLIEAMQDKGIVGPSQPGAQSLEVLDYGPTNPPVDEA